MRYSQIASSKSIHGVCSRPSLKVRSLPLGVHAAYAYFNRKVWFPVPLGAMSVVTRVWRPPENLPITLM